MKTPIIILLTAVSVFAGEKSVNSSVDKLNKPAVESIRDTVPPKPLPEIPGRPMRTSSLPVRLTA